MSTFFVSLASIEAVKQFVSAASLCPCEVDVVDGRYVINAKSIMGLFSLDLTRPIKVEVHGTAEECDSFRQQVPTVIVEEKG